MAGRPAQVKYQVRFRHHDGIAYASGTREADSLWGVVQAAMELLEKGYEVDAIERIVTRAEPLTEKEADAVRLLTGGKVAP